MTHAVTAASGRAARPQAAASIPATVLCAIYTRKSTNEGLDSDFNTLDAQREAGEAYVRSQRSEGWACLPDRYDDGGFSGGDMKRPALRRLLADIETGKIDCVVVYKVDRLSRSLLDFARIMEVFDGHGASFVSVTQQFNTTTSMGRLTLHVLLSFAQFEREIIGERTRDKMAAARKKGKWVGGTPPLGYDPDKETKRLVENKTEASLVRAIFRLYIKHHSLRNVVSELDRRGARTKSWVSRKGRQHGGKPFDKPAIRRIISNLVYAGKVCCRGEVYEGEHPAVIDQETFDHAQEILRHNGRTGGSSVRNKHGALLRGILRCAACDSPMIHNFTRNHGRFYRYYVCGQARKRGWHTCPTKQVPAKEIEDFVVGRIRRIACDPGLVGETLRKTATSKASHRAELEAEQKRLTKDLAKLGGEARGLMGALDEKKSSSLICERLSELEGLIEKTERRATEVREKLIAVERGTVDEEDLKSVLAHFAPVWDVLFPREQARILRLLIERVDWDRQNESLEIAFRPTGIKSLLLEASEGAGEKGSAE